MHAYRLKRVGVLYNIRQWEAEIPDRAENVSSEQYMSQSLKKSYINKKEMALWFSRKEVTNGQTISPTGNVKTRSHVISQAETMKTQRYFSNTCEIT
jgi:hypothetical protein